MSVTPEYVAGSFRDPSGRVFTHQDRIYRTVTDKAADEFQAAVDSGIIDDLVGQGLLVGWADADGNDFDLEDNVQRVIEQEKLPFVSYPYEWSFGALKSAALCHLDIQIAALERGIALSDATAYNVTFKGAKPVFMDYLSFRRYRDGEFWLGHKQFCEQFLNPLLLQAKLDIHPNAWYRGNLEGIPNQDMARLLGWKGWLSGLALINTVLPGVFERRAAKKSGNEDTAKMIGARKLSKAAYGGMLQRLRDGIAKLSKPGGVTVWQDYADNTSYAPDETAAKERAVARFTDKVRPQMIWDIGCNTGHYSKLALDNGAGHAVGFEFDTGALDLAFARAESEDLPFTPLYMNAVNPSPSLGWNEGERASLGTRRNADAMIALAVIHHICIGKNIPLEDAVAWLVGLAPNGLIEFVPKADPMVQELLRLREDVFADYTDEAFDAALAKHARVVDSEVVNASGRRLVWYAR